jgi:hypothetical protein
MASSSLIIQVLWNGDRLSVNPDPAVVHVGDGILSHAAVGRDRL